MKTLLKIALVLFLISTSALSYSQEVQTLFSGNSLRSSGGYGALTNKFTKIGGDYANLSGVYGGWYINHKFLIGVAGAATTNNIPVPAKYSLSPDEKMSYEYGQFGLMTEYVLGSNKVVHVSFQLQSGAAFTTQYSRYNWEDGDNFNWDTNKRNTDWFVLTEPGVNVEVNVFKWMRFCSGISYRASFGNDDLNGLKTRDINGASLNASLKFGKF